MGRKEPLGRKHKAGTGNMKDVPAARIISKDNVSFGIQATSQACGLPLPWHMSDTWQHPPHVAFLDVQASSSGAEVGEPRNVIIKLRGLPRPEARKQPQAPRPKTNELGDIRVDTLSRDPFGIPTGCRPRAEVHAEFAEKNSMCTCSSGVPSFLCRAVQCYAFEIGMCDPEIGHWDWYRRGKHPSCCDCIPWEKNP